MDYGKFYDAMQLASSRLLRYYACEVAKRVTQEAKTASILEAIEIGYELASQRQIGTTFKIERLKNRLRDLASNCIGINRSIARQCGVQCVVMPIRVNEIVQVVNGVRMFKGRNFDEDVFNCIRPDYKRNRSGVKNPDILAIAHKMHDDQDPEIGLILADALEEYDILNTSEHLSHLRSGFHCRGCWVVDEIMGNW